MLEVFSTMIKLIFSFGLVKKIILELFPCRDKDLTQLLKVRI